MRSFLFVLLLLPVLADAALVIDGRIDEAEWQQAQRFDRFVSVQPLTGTEAPADRRAEALLLSTPDGIAVAIRAWHPASLPQTRARMRRDAGEQVDRFNFMVDFNGDGRTGYDFTVTTAGDVMDEVISNENSFKSDWDGVWQHAVADFDGGYAVELLIPWSIAPMAGSSAPTRTIAVYFDRVIAATGERFAYPDASYQRARFVSDFARIEVPQFRQQSFAVTPYAVALHDSIGGDTRYKSGGDLFWKPTGDHQFALTINPDFGQVESDQLVVDFSAVETFFTDKRPFFTENHSAFAVSHPLAELFYTRRVGGVADDGSGAAAIDYAIKGNGSIGRFGYGVFSASEAGEGGRDFHLLRATHGSEQLNLGFTHGVTERPVHDRQAQVSAVDALWRPSASWLVRPLFVHSEIEQAGQRRRGHGGGVVADWDLPGPWRQQYFALWSDADLQLNDLGYQARNDFRQFEWETGYRRVELPAASAYSSHDWEFELLHRENTAGLRLLQSASLYRSSSRRNGSSQFAGLRWNRPAFDDLLSRGNGALHTQGGPAAWFEHVQPRNGDGRLGWAWYIESFPNAIAGRSVLAGVRPRWHVNDHFDVDLGLYRRHQSDWLLWQGGREFGSFAADRAELFSNLNWFIGERNELRVKLQAIAIDARALQARRLLPDGRMADSDAPLEDFRLRNLGFQLRYRYKLGKLSDFYAVYSRGGYAVDDSRGGLGDTLGDTFSLRDNDQILLKIAYRFEPFR